jgi:uncharacterized protein (TIGR00251 family)
VTSKANKGKTLLPSQPYSPFLHAAPEGIIIRIRVQPGAKKTAWAGLTPDAIKVSVQVPPVEGAANRVLIEFLADQFRLKKSEVILLKGEHSRSKAILLKGLEPGRCLALIRDLDQNRGI